jgi:hypothetical protein
MSGFTNTHYPSRVAEEFEGKSRIGPYGDAFMELDGSPDDLFKIVR